MEFTLIPSIGEGGQIKTNAAELLKEIEKPLQKYNYIVTPETYAQAKADRANLNKIAARISDERKRIETDVFKNWIRDKQNIMDVEKRIKSSSVKLGEGIKAIDDEEKEQKKENIIRKWNEAIGDKYNINAAWNKKWLNRSYPFSEIEKDLERIKDKIAKEIEIMKTFIPEDKAEQAMILNAYRTSLDISLAKAEADRIQKAHEEARREAERQAHMQPEQLHMNFANGTVESHEEKVTINEPEPVVDDAEPQYYAQFTVVGTHRQLELLTGVLVAAQKEISFVISIDKKGKVE